MFRLFVLASEEINTDKLERNLFLVKNGGYELGRGRNSVSV